MSELLKQLVALAGNIILAGFFGLACAFLNLNWLEYAIQRFPAVDYTLDFQLQFAASCAGAYLLISLFRILQSHAQTMFPRGADVGILFVFILIAMVGFTPVLNSHLLRYLIERSGHNVPETAHFVQAGVSTNSIR